MIQSPEWKAIAVAATIACASMSLLAVDAAVDLNVSGLTKRLESALASIVEPMEPHQLAFAVPTWACGATEAFNAGATIKMVKGLLTHDEERTTLRYIRRHSENITGAVVDLPDAKRKAENDGGTT